MKYIELLGRKYPYEIKRKKMKNIIVRVSPELVITISANMRVPEKEILVFLQSRADWIEETYREREKKANKSLDFLQFQTGETVRLLGRDLQLIILESSANSITWDEKNLYFTVQTPYVYDTIKGYFHSWVDAICTTFFQKEIEKVYPHFAAYGILMPKWKVRDMKSCWGSYNKSTNTITLNRKLITVSEECMAYVIMHEFIHIIHYNHGKGFHALLSEFMPDYKERKKLLTVQGIL